MGFSDEVIDFSGGYENGSLVRVCTAKGKFLGTGFVNDNSKIRIRLISENHNDRFDNDFYYRRLKWAVEYRKCVMGDDFSNCRIIFMARRTGFPGSRFSPLFSLFLLLRLWNSRILLIFTAPL